MGGAVGGALGLQRKLAEAATEAMPSVELTWNALGLRLAHEERTSKRPIEIEVRDQSLRRTKTKVPRFSGTKHLQIPRHELQWTSHRPSSSIRHPTSTFWASGLLPNACTLRGPSEGSSGPVSSRMTHLCIYIYIHIHIYIYICIYVCICMLCEIWACILKCESTC